MIDSSHFATEAVLRDGTINRAEFKYDPMRPKPGHSENYVAEFGANVKASDISLLTVFVDGNPFQFRFSTAPTVSPASVVKKEQPLIEDPVRGLDEQDQKLLVEVRSLTKELEREYGKIVNGLVTITVQDFRRGDTSLVPSPSGIVLDSYKMVCRASDLTQTKPTANTSLAWALERELKSNKLFDKNKTTLVRIDSPDEGTPRFFEFELLVVRSLARPPTNASK